MKILDLSAGNRAIWFNKKHPLATYLDCRPEVEPDFVCNTTQIPKEVGKDFDLVVFDPPHTNLGPKSDMAKTYGHHTSSHIKWLIFGTSQEVHRITKKNALMALKWSDHSIKLNTVFELMPKWEPLFGHSVKSTGGTKHRKDGNQTFWYLLRRID